MDDEPMVVESYASDVEANMSKSILAAEGIEAVVMGDDAGGMYPQLHLPLGLQLVVRRHDFERAREILGVGS
ncbi:MAG: putative signal transducing protein [Thermoleophilia bacterium]